MLNRMPYLWNSNKFGVGTPGSFVCRLSLQAKRRMEEERMAQLEKYREDYEAPTKIPAGWGSHLWPEGFWGHQICVVGIWVLGWWVGDISNSWYGITGWDIFMMKLHLWEFDSTSFECLRDFDWTYSSSRLDDILQARAAQEEMLRARVDA